MNEERLQKYLSRAGVASRRKAEALIAAGEVTVNGRPAVLGMKVTADDDVRVQGRTVGATPESVTYALYKPAGVLSTVSDDRGRPTVMELLPDVPGLHPVGR
ncbi:MAG TPA: S4 domain-containing protein, partial [Trueperaceae bacterium]